MNDTAGTCEQMLVRAQVAKEFGVPIVMHDYLTGGLTANTSLALYCCDHGLLLHIHRAMHAVIDRQRNHGIHFRVLSKACRMSRGIHIWHMPALVSIFGDDACLQFGGGALSHSIGHVYSMEEYTYLYNWESQLS